MARTAVVARLGGNWTRGRRLARALTWLALPLLWAAAPSAGAAQQPVRAGQARVGVGLGVLDLVLEPERDEDALGAALGLTDLSTLLDVGYQLTDALLIGTRLELAYGKPLGASTDLDRFEMLVVPYVHHLFLRGLLRPFVGAEVGGGVVSKTRRDDREGILLLGALAGLHYFVSYTAAVSPWIRVGYEHRTNVDRHLLRVTLYLTVSIWFGGPSGFRDPARALVPEPVPVRF